jgi:hypothetical protein
LLTKLENLLLLLFLFSLFVCEFVAKYAILLFETWHGISGSHEIFGKWRLGFVNYKKGCTRLAAASDKVYQLLAHGWWFSPGTPASSTIINWSP